MIELTKIFRSHSRIILMSISILCLINSGSLYSATIWSEDFSSYTDGTGHDGKGDLGDYPASVTKWTLDYSNSIFFNAFPTVT